RRRGDRLPPDGRQPDAPLPADRRGRRRQRHVPLRGGGRRSRDDRRRARARSRGRRRIQPRDRAGRRGRRRGRRGSRPLHEHPPGLRRSGVHAGGAGAARDVARAAAGVDRRAGRRRDRQRQRSLRLRRRRAADRRRHGDLRARGPAARLPPARLRARVTPYERALELAERGRGKVEDHPVVGAVVAAADGAVVGEGWYEYARVDHAEPVALAQAGDRARGATLYVTLEPCNHRGRTPPCAQAVIDAGIARVVVGARDPNPKAAGGIEALRAAGVEVELLDDWRAHVQNEAWRTWVAFARPFVTYKVAVSLDGRVVVPGRRWVSGGESRRRVHELRAASDAVAVGMGTVRADAPRLDARGVD